MTNSCIRPAQPADASRLAEILVFAKRAAYRDIFQDDYGSFAQIQVLPLALEFAQGAGLEDIFVAEEAGIIKGMMRWKGRGAEAELCELYVDPFFQGDGLGKKLLAQFFCLARAYGAKKARLWVLEQNSRARSFYEKSGFAANGNVTLEPGYSVRKLEYENSSSCTKRRYL